MDQYDITAFILNNKKEIKEYLREESEHLYRCEDIFNKYPELFNDSLVSFMTSKLRHYLSVNLNLDFEEISLIVDEQFVINVLGK